MQLPVLDHILRLDLLCESIVAPFDIINPIFSRRRSRSFDNLFRDSETAVSTMHARRFRIYSPERTDSSTSRETDIRS
jgi:hypothetical protein